MLPLVVVVPVLTSVVGAIKGLDAMDTMADAKEIADRAADRYPRSLAGFDAQRATAVEQLARYGAIRLAVFDDDLRRLQDALESVGGMRSSKLAQVDLDLAVQIEALGLADVDFRAIDAVKAGLASAGTGATAYLAALGAVGTFATASTGTPIAVLSGAAAWNATLAWLGGGAMAAGGMGAGVGAAMLGGIVLGPALAVGALAFSAKANRRHDEAKAYAAKVNRAVQELQSATRAAKVIGSRAVGFFDVACTLRDALAPRVDAVCAVAASGRGFSDLSNAERRDLHVTFELAKTVKTLLDTPLITDDGQPSPAAKDPLDAARIAADEVRR